MFAKAYETAVKFTRPLIISERNETGGVKCRCGAFIILNDEGWILTAAHIFKAYLGNEKTKSQIREIKGSVSDHAAAHYAFWWGMDGVRISDVRVLVEADILVGRLEPFRRDMVGGYPTIMNPEDMKIASGLCKLGYPFTSVEAVYDEKHHKFSLAGDTLPGPPFPTEGIYTRKIFKGDSEDGLYRLMFLETSSPGLKGQSGGPVVDIDGNVWGIQGGSINYSLGLSPTVLRDGREIKIDQFYNTGIGAHAELIRSFLKENGISFKCAR